MSRVIFEFEDDELFAQLLGKMKGAALPEPEEEGRVFPMPAWMKGLPVSPSPCFSCSNYGKGACHCTLGSSTIC